MKQVEDLLVAYGSTKQPSPLMRAYEIAKHPCLSVERSESISLGVSQLRGFTAGDAVKVEYNQTRSNLGFYCSSATS